MHTEGGCLCGNIRYEFSDRPLWTGYCHCNSCRRSTGAVVACFVGVRPDKLRFTGAQCSQYQSSPGVSRGHCPMCATPVSYQADRWPNEIHLYTGTLDNPQALAPAFHVYTDEKISWFETNDELPRYRQSTIDA